MKHKVALLFCLACLLIGGCEKTEEEKTAATTQCKTTQESTTEESVPTTAVGTTEAATTEKKITAEDIDEMKAGSIVDETALAAVSLEELFHVDEISDEVFERIDGISYGEGCVVDRDELRYIRILYYGFDENTHVGEIISNESIAGDLKEIFEELYENRYPIEKVVLVDEYGGDDNASMADNNTSCFNFRNVPGSDHLSKHAYGRAIDINPLYNPYINSDGEVLPEEGECYADRSVENPYKIDEDDLCFQLFDEHGFTWGGFWNSVKDYQHFQK